MFALAALGCRPDSPSRTELASTSVADEREAERVLGGARLPPRPDVVALADRLASAASRAGSAELSFGLLRRAAALRERLFRTSHHDVDAREVAALLEAEASSASPGACAAALRRAGLQGETAGLGAAAGEAAAGAAPTLARALASVARAASARDDLACSSRATGLLESLGPFAASAPYTASAPTAPPREAVATPDDATLHASGPARVTAFETFGQDQGARVVLRLSAPASFSFGAAPARSAGEGPRLYLDLARTSTARGLDRERAVGGLLTRVRLGPHEGGTRVVLDLTKDAFRRVFYLPEPFRVVIDVTTRAPRQALAAAPGSRREVRRVVLDPGHGGVDPGAVGPAGNREKDLTLDVAHRAAPVLANELGIVTLLTRDDDSTVALEERTARANAFGADLFVSLHCNASESPAARGVESFVLDTTSDTVAARIAARENAASPDAGAVVSRLVTDLKLAELGARSTHFAELLQRAAASSLAARYAPVQDLGVKTAGFFVLVGAQMPSALFEMSFLSNPTEEARLADADYRQRLADAVVNAVRAYRDGL